MSIDIDKKLIKLQKKFLEHQKQIRESEKEEILSGAIVRVFYKNDVDEVEEISGIYGQDDTNFLYMETSEVTLGIPMRNIILVEFYKIPSYNKSDIWAIKSRGCEIG